MRRLSYKLIKPSSEQRRIFGRFYTAFFVVCVIITIAREHGSAGKQIGKEVAEKLNIPFYYKEVAALAAEESGLHKEFISDINANSPGLLHELYLSTSVVQQAIIAQEQITAPFLSSILPPKFDFVQRPSVREGVRCE